MTHEPSLDPFLFIGQFHDAKTELGNGRHIAANCLVRPEPSINPASNLIDA